MRVVQALFMLALAAGSPALAQPNPSGPTTEPAPQAQPPAPQAQPTLPTPSAAPPSQVPQVDTERFEKLEAENAKLREDLELLREDHEYVEKRLEKGSSSSVKLTGYLDMGFFAVAGDGSGIETDVGNTNFPEYSDIPDSWVFMGDPLSTMINSRGDPATTSTSRAIKFDAIKGHTSTFLINNLNVGLFSEIGDKAVFTAKLDILPRGRDVENGDGLFLGDYLDLRLAYLEYRLQKGSTKLDLFAGKFDSVIGFEYRNQEAPTRIEVTPSLICRYTCGYPIGIKARARFFDDALVLNGAVTNGSQFSEGFGLYNEIDTNQFKTVSGRLSYRLPVLKELEFGISGAFGAQDNQTSEKVYQWLWAADMHFHRHNFVLRAEFVKGRANGENDPSPTAPAPCDISACLEFKGAYGLIGYRTSNIAMPYARVDWRDALHRQGVDFVYISQLVRATFGLRLTLTENVTVKAEFTVNQELGRIPINKNDVFTSSLVVKY